MRRPLAAIAGLAALVASCGYAGPSASTLLQRGKAAFDHTSAFHLQLTSQDATGSGILLTGANGDAVRPDGFRGNLQVEQSGLNLQVSVVSTAGHFYIQLPFSAAYQSANPAEYGFADPGKLLDPNTGISTLLTSAQNPKIGSSVRYNGESLQQVDATLPGQLVASLLVDADPSQPVSVVDGIDTANNQLRTVDLTGPLYQAGHQSTFHLILTGYGENVSVTPPPT